MSYTYEIVTVVMKMRYFEHSGTRAIIAVDDNGKKSVKKHGMTFRSFMELHMYEKEIVAHNRKLMRDRLEDRQVREANHRSTRRQVDAYLRSKGEY